MRWRSTVQMWTALRWGRAAHPLPVGQQPGDQPFGFQRLPDLDGRAARAEEGDELFACLGGPGRGEGTYGGGHPPYGVQGDREVRLRGGGCGAQREHGVALGTCGAGEPHLAVLFDDSFGEGGPLGDRLAAAQHGAQPWAYGPRAQDASHFAPGDVAGVRHDARCLVHLAQQGVGVQQAEFGGDLVLFLEREAVGGAAGGEVQGVTDVQEPATGVRESFAGASASQDAATARSATASRSPPRASFRSGSRRYWSSPWRSARSAHSSWSWGSRFGAWLRQSARTAVRSPAVRPRSPAM